LINLRQPLHLWEITRRLGLAAPSTMRLFVSYYFGRRAVLQRFAPGILLIDVPQWGKIPLRTNGEDHSLLKQIFVDQVYRVPMINVRHIVDLGANIGVATVFLSRLFPDAEIACVEPSPQNTPLLEQTITLNGIRARVFETAIGPRDGLVDLFLSSTPDCTSAVHADNSFAVTRVPQITMPHVMREMGWDGIDVLKIDIEGSERYLLTENQDWLGRVKMVVGESHLHVDYSYAQLQRDLGERGFALETVIAETNSYGATFQGTNSRIPVV
jgi:FkbM family methyltransferase